MRSKLIFTAAAVAMVAACGQSQPTQPIVVRGEEQDQLHKLDDMNRAIGLKRAIYASGFTCKRIARSGYVQEHENLSMWAAICDDGREWAIFIGPDGSAQVRPCKDVVQLGLPACVIKPGAAKPG